MSVLVGDDDSNVDLVGKEHRAGPGRRKGASRESSQEILVLDVPEPYFRRRQFRRRGSAKQGSAKQGLGGHLKAETAKQGMRRRQADKTRLVWSRAAGSALPRSHILLVRRRLGLDVDGRSRGSRVAQSREDGDGDANGNGDGNGVGRALRLSRCRADGLRVGVVGGFWATAETAALPMADEAGGRLAE